MANINDLLLTAGIDLSKFNQDKKTLISEVLGMDETFKKGGEGISQAFGRAIAQQKLAIKDIESELNKVYNKANSIAPGQAQANILGDAKKIEGDLQFAKNELNDLQELKISLVEVGGSVDRLSTKFNEAKNRLAELNRNGANTSSPEYIKAVDDVKEYGTALRETNAQAKSLSQDGLGNVIGKLSAVSGGLAVAQSLVGIFGDKNEDLNQIMLKTQALLSASVTLNQIKNTSVAQGGIISGIAAVQEAARARATALAGNATVIATAKQRIFNLVANANPYVLLATALITVVGAIGLYISATSEASKKAKEMVDLNGKIADSVAEPLIAYKTLQAQWNELGDDLKAKEKFITDNKDEFAKLNVEVLNVKDAENVLVSNSQNFVDAMMLRAKGAAVAQLAIENLKNTMQLESEYRRQNIDEDLTVWEKVWRGPSSIGANKTLMREEAEQIKKSKQRDQEYLQQKIKLAKDLEQLDKNSGFKTPGTTQKTKNNPKSKSNTDNKADEFLPLGSVAEIQKRINAIDKLLSKSTDQNKINALKEKRISTEIELTEAIKKIEIKSFQERASLQESYQKAYAIILEKYGKEQADKMYGPLMEGTQSYYQFLDNEREKLNQKQTGGFLTEKEKADLAFILEKQSQMRGEKSVFEKFTEGIDDAISKIPTLAGQIEFLQNKASEQLGENGNKSFDNGEQKFLKEREQEKIRQAKENYQRLLDEQETFQEKAILLQKEFEEIKKSNSYINSSGSDQSKIDKSFSDRMSKLQLDILKDSADWEMAFGNMDFVSQSALKRIEENLLKFKEVEGTTLAPTELRELENALKRVRDAQASNPFTSVITGLKTLKVAKDDVYFATERYNAAVKNSGSGSDAAIKASKELADADRKQAEAKEKLYSDINKAQGIFNAIGEGVLDIADSFGGLDDATKDAVENIMAIGNAALDLGKSISTGDVAGMIKAGIKLIGSVLKAINGDQKKERQIKKQAKVLKELEAAYNSVAFAAERAIGAQKYDSQRDLIKNLEIQKILIQQMLDTEASKKKADSEKINEYQNQIVSISQSIESLKEGILKDVLQTDIPEMASKIGDALLQAFGKGEDGVKAVSDAFDDMVKNILKNQLNKILESQMSSVYQNLLKASGFNSDGTGTFDGLTPQEIADLKAQAQAAAAQGQQFIEAYSSIFEGLDTNADGLKGDIKGVTEKTAGILEGQLNAIRIYQVEVFNIHKKNQIVFANSLQNLVLIEFNTRRLHSIDDGIKDLNDKIKKNLVGFP